MLKITNYYYSHEQQRATTAEFEFQDDDTLELEINIRYPIRIKAAELKKAIVANELALNNDENFTPMTQEEFEKDPVIDETTIFYFMFRNLIRQMIEELYIDDEKETQKMYDTLKNTELIQILSDICNPMRVKRLTEIDLNRHTCCGPFPNLGLNE